jgi:acetyltransferase-like isoleucine patch superfamily enzyme
MPVTYGKYTYGEIKEVAGEGNITVGNFCSISGKVKAFMAQDHNYNCISTFPFAHPGLSFGKHIDGYSRLEEDMNIVKGYDINVGSDVWLGYGCVLFRGINVGCGSIIGAFTRVTKNIPPYSVVVGDSRILRKRFSDEDIDFLMKLKWWDMEDKEIGKMVKYLRTRDINLLKNWVEENYSNV